MWKRNPCGPLLQNYLVRQEGKAKIPILDFTGVALPRHFINFTLHFPMSTECPTRAYQRGAFPAAGNGALGLRDLGALSAKAPQHGTCPSPTVKFQAAELLTVSWIHLQPPPLGLTGPYFTDHRPTWTKCQPQHISLMKMQPRAYWIWVYCPQSATACAFLYLTGCLAHNRCLAMNGE